MFLLWTPGPRGLSDRRKCSVSVQNPILGDGGLSGAQSVQFPIDRQLLALTALQRRLNDHRHPPPTPRH